MSSILKDEKLHDQMYASAINLINERRMADELLQQKIQDENFLKAVSEIDNVRKIIGSPNKILGFKSRKHGEIAEFLEVHITKARQALEGQEITATFDGIARTAPDDYKIDGITYQSKFWKSPFDTLNAILKHLENNPNYRSGDSHCYIIPRDQHEVIEKIIDGDKSYDAGNIEELRSIVTKIEHESGKSFKKLVMPSISKYSDAKTAVVKQTLDNHEEQITKTNTQKKVQISQEHKANVGEALKTTASAAVVAASVSLTIALYKKAKEGKKFYKGDFSAEDWKEVGIKTVKGGGIGAISSLALYNLTNYAHLSAPLAGAIVSSIRAVKSLENDLNNGRIDKKEFLELGMIVCSEAALVGLVTAAGQTFIPIPFLGAAIGSVAGPLFARALGSENKVTAQMIRKDIDDYLQVLDTKYVALVDDITKDFANLGELTEFAFNPETNLKLLNLSIDLARAYGVEDKKILKSTEEIDSFMLE